MLNNNMLTLEFLKQEYDGSGKDFNFDVVVSNGCVVVVVVIAIVIDFCV
jgi:hypothetical protein